MRKPRTAPNFWDAFKEITKDGSDNLTELFAKSNGAALERYFHWDEIAYRDPPAGLTRDQWWFLLKFQRQSLKQPIPLRDKADAPMHFAMSPTVLRHLHQIDLRAGGQIKMPEQVTNHETRDSYYVSSLIEEAITSSQLEGATTTRQVAKQMLRTGRAPRDRSERMILNNFFTMRKIGAIKDKPLSRDLILEIHRLITDETLDDPTAAGRFRRDDEAVGVYDNSDNKLMHDPPEASQVEARISEMCEFANQKEPFVHPVIRSIILHFMLGYDHPFVDGNGRTARALFYWSMLRNGYWLAEFISISQIVLKAPAQYARAFLYSETDEGDLTYFILYHLKVLMRSLESLHEYIARKAAEIQQSETELRGIDVLNHRQRALIRHALRHPGQLYTVKGHQLSQNVSYESARSDLLDLARRDLLEATRDAKAQGNKWVFTARTQLTGRLAAMASRASGSATLF